MNFDWSDQDQIAGTVWGELNESEDHIVPYPKAAEENTLFTFEDRSKKPFNQDAITAVQSSGQSSGAKNENEVSGPTLDMDTWPDLPALNAELSTGDLSSLNTSFSSLAAPTVQLDGASGLFGDVIDDKVRGSFLDGDWANIGDFNDLDRFFRDDSVFGHDMVANVDNFLPQSADVMGSTTPSMAMPDISLSRDKDQSCSSFNSAKHSGGKRKAEYKTADILESREQAIHQTDHSDQLIGKEDRKKKLLKYHKKAEEGSKNSASHISSGSWPRNTSQTQPHPGLKPHPPVLPPSQDFHSPAFASVRQISDNGGIESIISPSQFMQHQYGYPAYPFPGPSLPQNAQGHRNEQTDVYAHQHLYQDSISSSNTSNTASEFPLAMTPEEKIEKLRRRQQAQALLAVQQQQLKQFSYENIGAESFSPRANFINSKAQDSVGNIGHAENVDRLSLSGPNLLSEQEESQKTSTLIHDDALKQTIYYQLQDALQKLDNRFRHCIRDSLIRLARSSTERQTVSDGSDTNKTTRFRTGVHLSEAANHEERRTTLQNLESGTNPIDRTVAHLLFHRPLEGS